MGTNQLIFLNEMDKPATKEDKEFRKKCETQRIFK